MSKKEVRWFSIPFLAPKGKGSKPKKSEGEMFEIDPPPESAPCRFRYDDPLNLTPKERRERIVELLAVGLRRLMTKRKQRSKKSQDNPKTERAHKKILIK